MKPHDPVNWNGNIDHEWSTSKKNFMLYLQAIGCNGKPDARKIALLLTVAGRLALELYNMFMYLDDQDKNKFDTVVQKFDQQCLPQKYWTFECYIFRSLVQQLAESVHMYLIDLKLKGRTCNFRVLRDSMIHDQVVFGILNKMCENICCERLS